MEGLSIVVITTPIVLPAVVALGYDPVWFGVALVMLMEMGLLTPPVGVNLFVIQGISRAPLGEVVKGAMPFFLIQVIGFLPVIFFPAIITWLPSLIYGS
jgi:TRAP-type C4-dicarboxylate transport system permease large subunit